MFPLDIIDGLVYLRMRPFTDEEYAALPHVPFTSDVTWDATVLDCTISDHPNWHDNLNGGEYESHFDAQSHYLHRDCGETMDAIITTFFWFQLCFTCYNSIVLMPEGHSH
jgi:hypothetical protein